DRALALFDLFLGLGRERFVDDLQQRVVLPQADAERDGEHGAADHQARSQLVEVVNEAQLLLVRDRADGGGHGPPTHPRRDPAMTPGVPPGGPARVQRFLCTTSSRLAGYAPRRRSPAQRGSSRTKLKPPASRVDEN